MKKYYAIKKYHTIKKLYTNKFSKLDEIDIVLKKRTNYQNSRKKMDNPNSAVSLKSIQLLVKTFPQRRRQAQVDLLVNYARLILLKVFQKIEDERILSSSSYEASVTLIPQPDRDFRIL